MDSNRDKEKINEVWHCAACNVAVVTDDKRVSKRTTIGGAFAVLITSSPLSFLLKSLLMLAVFAASSYKFFSWVQYHGQLSARTGNKEQPMKDRNNG